MVNRETCRSLHVFISGLENPHNCPRDICEPGDRMIASPDSGRRVQSDQRFGYSVLNWHTRCCNWFIKMFRLSYLGPTCKIWDELESSKIAFDSIFPPKSFKNLVFSAFPVLKSSNFWSLFWSVSHLGTGSAEIGPMTLLLDQDGQKLWFYARLLRGTSPRGRKS